jgi:ribosome-binding protein aMBF1 (putative translation factor)
LVTKGKLTEAASISKKIAKYNNVKLVNNVEEELHQIYGSRA